MQWIVDNKEWFFSGIGVSIIAAIIGTVVKRIKLYKELIANVI